jgi:hypothetical protein
MDVYPLDEGNYKKLDEIQKALHAGTDRERDFGHKIWLILEQLRDTGTVEVEL